MAKHGAQPAVLSIFDLTQPVAVLDPRLPAGDIAEPGPDVIVDADVAAQHLAAPTIVVAGDPEHWDSRFDQISKRREHAKRRARDDEAPLEPELEQIAVDDDRSRSLLNMAKKGEQPSLDLGSSGAEVGVGEDVARRREHADSLLRPDYLYKQVGSTHYRGRCSSLGATAPIAHSLVVLED